MTTRTIIIGGGVAGLATAILLAKEGHEVQLFEKNDTLGGRVATLEQDGFRFDLGPSWYLMPKVFDHFFHLAGTSSAQTLSLVPLNPMYRVFPEPGTPKDKAQPVTVPAGRDRITALFERLESGCSRALDAYLASATDTAQMAEKFFLYNPFTRYSWLLSPEILRRIPKLIPLLTSSLERYAARHFKHPVIRQVLGFPAVFLATSPAQAPAMYHLMSQLDLDEGVLYPMGGFTEFIAALQRLAEEAGVTITTQAEVSEIHTVPKGPGAPPPGRQRSRSQRNRRHTVSGITWQDHCGASHRADADIVVSAADLHHTETQLVPSGQRTYPESWWQRRVSGPGAVIVTLGVRGKLPQLPHHSLFFCRDWNQNFASIFGAAPKIPDPASIYVCKPSETDQSVAPAGDENLFLLIPIPADTRIGRSGPHADVLHEISESAIEQVAQWAHIPDLRNRIITRTAFGPADFETQYHSWRGGMLGPAHILRQSAMFRAQNESRKISGLMYAGSTVAPGVGVPMCLISAELVLKRLRGDHSPGPLPEHAIQPRYA